MVLHSLNDLGAAFGIPAKKRRENNKPFYCRKCGGVMRHIPNTNVFLCENEMEDGAICNHRVLTGHAF